MRERTLQTFGTNRYLLEALNNYSVEYIVVGGVAVHYYDPTRKFDDLDLQINPTEVNAQRTIDALKSLGVGVEFDAQQLAGQKKQIMAGFLNPKRAKSAGRTLEQVTPEAP